MLRKFDCTCPAYPKYARTVFGLSVNDAAVTFGEHLAAAVGSRRPVEVEVRPQGTFDVYVRSLKVKTVERYRVSNANRKEEE